MTSVATFVVRRGATSAWGVSIAAHAGVVLLVGIRVASSHVESAPVSFEVAMDTEAESQPPSTAPEVMPNDIAAVAVRPVTPSRHPRRRAVAPRSASGQSGVGDRFEERGGSRHGARSRGRGRRAPALCDRYVSGRRGRVESVEERGDGAARRRSGERAVRRERRRRPSACRATSASDVPTRGASRWARGPERSASRSCCLTRARSRAFGRSRTRDTGSRRRQSQRPAHRRSPPR